MNEQLKSELFHGACPHDCPDTCAMTYEVKGGRLVDVRGSKEHPMTRGGLCVIRRFGQPAARKRR